MLEIQKHLQAESTYLKTVEGSQLTDIHAILKSLTLEEKISMLAGKNFWETVGYPEKGVPSLKVSDGPNGARGAQFQGGTTAACFPASILLAATWDLGLVRKIGNALADETRTKGADVLLGPTVCPHRHVLGGRNFESFSEDPLLAGKLAAQYIKGLQEKGVGATIKHFAANEQETRRCTTDVRVDERTLREIYLKPFEIAIKEANPWSVMTSYNLVNGYHSDMNEFLLKTVLRGEWGWRGLVMSDWGGTNSMVESLNAGLDLEMPGPTRNRKVSNLSAAIQAGKINEKTIDERCLNLLELLVKTDKFNHPKIAPERSVDDPAHRRLIRETAGQGMVLLKNRNDILPLDKDKLRGKKIAVLGLAKEALIHGGGSASVNAHYKVSPWQALTEVLGENAELLHSQGAQVFKLLPGMKRDVVDHNKCQGWLVERFDSPDFTGRPTLIEHGEEAVLSPLTLQGTWVAARVSGIYKPSIAGSHYLGFSSMGPGRLLIDDIVVCEQKDNISDSMAFLFGGNDEINIRYEFVKDREYRIAIESFASKPADDDSTLSVLIGMLGVRLGFMSEQEHDEDILSAATKIAQEADLVLVFTGHTTVWETEGQDQMSMSLPANGSQDRLINAASSVNPSVVVINSTGVAISMPWISKVSAVLQTWFPGQEAGHAIVDVLMGAVNPSGRLPISIPVAIEDTPAFGNFPGAEHPPSVHYEEGTFIGYRHYDRINSSKTLFPFGYGLSYTKFTISNLALHSDETVSLKVTNIGRIAGSHVVQVYIGRRFETVQPTPVKQLVAFKKVFVKAGENIEVSIPFKLTDVAWYDIDKSDWVLEEGEYNVSVGSSVTDIHETVVMSFSRSL